MIIFRLFRANETKPITTILLEQKQIVYSSLVSNNYYIVLFHVLIYIVVWIWAICGMFQSRQLKRKAICSVFE